jgi:predicted DsbA family dithiol-disulfide isomerase
MRIDIFSDTVCPWCLLGKRRFDAAVAKRAHCEPRVIYRPFELNPDVPLEGIDRAAFLAARLTDHERFAESQRALVSLGAAVGVEFRFDRIARVPNTRRSHLMISLAARAGLQSAVKERVMRAYFEEGIDIGDIEELVRLGCEVGMAEHETRRTLVLGAGTDAVVAAERHAVGLGLSGVPTFIFDRQYTISGAQEPDTLLRVFDQVAELGAQREAKA